MTKREAWLTKHVFPKDYSGEILEDIMEQNGNPDLITCGHICMWGTGFDQGTIFGMAFIAAIGGAAYVGKKLIDKVKQKKPTKIFLTEEEAKLFGLDKEDS